MRVSSVTLRLPGWIPDVCASHAVAATDEEKMTFVIELARRNVDEHGGGPFGAAVFDMKTHEILAAGVNQVVAQSCSVAHAETVALMLAQRALATYDLGAEGLPACELFTSAEPCAMCFGAVPWSGVRRLVCGARDEDARAIGFDEGPKLPGWVAALESRRIEVVRDVCRQAAVDVLQSYARQGGVIYNGGASRSST